MPTSLKGQVVAITGASQGIGRGLAETLSREGCRLALCARSQDKLESLAAVLRGSQAEVLIERVDVSREADVERFFAAIEHTYGRLDVLINNAGAFDGGPLDELTLEAWNNVIGACLTGAFLCSRAAFRLMKPQRRGRILNIGSISAQRPRAAGVPYAAAKFGVWGLTQAVALDGRPHGIVCSCLHPGNVMVERRQGSGSRADDEPMMSVETIVNAAMAMLQLPDDVNFLEAIVLPRDQEYLARG